MIRMRRRSCVAVTTVLLAALAFDAIAQSAQTSTVDLIERGRYLAIASDCTACHTAPRGGKAFAGGYPIVSAMGRIYSTNITPSKTHGIGDYSEAEFARALREGVRKDGAHLYPAMPYTSYAKLTDADVGALYTYFMRAVAPVDDVAQQTRLAFPFNLRFSMAAWNGLFLDDKPFIPDSSKSAQWNRGAYLVQGPAHCSACHTPRNALMAENASAAFSGGLVGYWYAPNITSDPISGIGRWSEADIVRYLGTGDVPGKAQAAGSMAEAIEHSFQYLAQTDLQAMAVYLKTVPAIRNPSDSAARDSFGAASNVETGVRGSLAAGLESGDRLFSGSCASCHQPDAGGSADDYYPTLFHNTSTGAGNASNLIAAILFGVERTVAGKPVFMPGFGPGSYVQELSNQEIADVSNFVLAHYGNSALHVEADDVAAVRAGGPVPFLAIAGKYAIPALIVFALALVVLVRRIRRRRQRRTAA